MSITIQPPFAQHDTTDSAVTHNYPVTLYREPVFNVGDPGNPGHRMLHTDLRRVFEFVRDGHPEWAPGPALIKQVRDLAPHKGEKDENGKPTQKSKAYENIKTLQLPFSVPGHYEPCHRHSPNPQRPSSRPDRPAHADRFPECRQYGAHPPIEFAPFKFVELDNLDAEGIDAARESLKEQPSVICFWLSAGGHGLHIFVLLDSVPTNDDEAHAAYETAVRALGIADSVANDANVKNLARLAFMSHDPNAWWNPSPVPLVEMPKNDAQGVKSADSAESGSRQSDGQAQKSGHTRATASEGGKSPWGDSSPENGTAGNGFGPQDDASADLVAGALQAMIAGKAGENDNHLLGVMVNLQQLGHRFEDFDRWAAAAGCTCDRRPRWDNPPGRGTNDKPGWAIANLAAAHYGFQYRKKGSTGRGSAKGNDKKANQQESPFAAPPPKPPAPSWDGLEPDYQAAWVAHAAAGAAVVVRDLNQRKKDGDIGYTLYAVDPATGRLDAGELMTKHRIKAASLYLGATVDLDQAEYAACARHAREMRDAKNAARIAANVGGSRECYPAVWRDVPLYTPLDLDSNLTVIGTPSGCWDVPGHQLLPPLEARDQLCTATIPWDYDPLASHPVALELFEYLYGDLQDTTTMQFARWRQAATALVRPPMQEIIVKISPSGSAKTTEGLLQENAFFPLVISGERAAIEEPSGYNIGGSSHNSYLKDFSRPARRINIPEVATEKKRDQKALNSRLLRDLSEKPNFTFRDPGPFLPQQVPYNAHLFIDGNLPTQGNDLLQIGDPDSDSAKAVMRRLRGSPYTAIPEVQQRPELFDYGNPARARNPQEADDIANFNRTIVRLMFDGMALHWPLLIVQLPNESYGKSLIYDLQNRGKAEWLVKWLPHALKSTGPGEEDTHTLAIYQSYLDWHDENGEGRPVPRRGVSEAVKTHYGLKPGAPSHDYLNGKRTATKYCPGWTLSTPASPELDAWF